MLSCEKSKYHKLNIEHDILIKWVCQIKLLTYQNHIIECEMIKSQFQVVYWEISNIFDGRNQLNKFFCDDDGS